MSSGAGEVYQISLSVSFGASLAKRFGRRRRGWGWLITRRLFSGSPECTVDYSPQLLLGNEALDTLAFNEDGRCSVYAQIFCFMRGGLHLRLVLLGDARLELR
jgi:hypothetical protein